MLAADRAQLSEHLCEHRVVGTTALVGLARVVAAANVATAVSPCEALALRLSRWLLLPRSALPWMFLRPATCRTSVSAASRLLSSTHSLTLWLTPSAPRVPL